MNLLQWIPPIHGDWMGLISWCQWNIHPWRIGSLKGHECQLHLVRFSIHAETQHAEQTWKVIICFFSIKDGIQYFSADPILKMFGSLVQIVKKNLTGNNIVGTSGYDMMMMMMMMKMMMMKMMMMKMMMMKMMMMKMMMMKMMDFSHGTLHLHFLNHSKPHQQKNTKTLQLLPYFHHLPAFWCIF